MFYGLVAGKPYYHKICVFRINCNYIPLIRRHSIDCGFLLGYGSEEVLSWGIADGELALSDLVTISEKAWRMQGSKMFVEVGKKIPVEDLLKGLIIQSGNDATIALAEHIAGSESAFAGYMNHQAKLMGMENTNFVNATGWPHEDHYSSARDIAILSQAVIRDYPESYRLYREKEYTYNESE